MREISSYSGRARSPKGGNGRRRSGRAQTCIQFRPEVMLLEDRCLLDANCVISPLRIVIVGPETITIALTSVPETTESTGGTGSQVDVDSAADATNGGEATTNAEPGAEPSADACVRIVRLNADLDQLENAISVAGDNAGHFYSQVFDADSAFHFSWTSAGVTSSITISAADIGPAAPTTAKTDVLVRSPSRAVSYPSTDNIRPLPCTSLCVSHSLSAPGGDAALPSLLSYSRQPTAILSTAAAITLTGTIAPADLEQLSSDGFFHSTSDDKSSVRSLKSVEDLLDALMHDSSADAFAGQSASNSNCADCR